ncbi:MAG: TonB family protein [Thermoanaerobaculia bacterium]
MKLAGDLSEFALSDLLQVKSAARQSSRFKVLSPQGRGHIDLYQGEVVDARYENLEAEPALFALIQVRSGYFEAVPLAQPERRTIRRTVAELLVDAQEQLEAGQVSKPRRPKPEASGATGAPAAEPGARVGSGRRALWLGVATGAMLALGLAGLAVLRTPQTAMAGAGQLDSAATSEGAIEASELTGPGDRPPQLLAGSPPPAPSQDLALLPTVVCRLRIDASGRVAEAKVFRSRVELAAFEEAALQAVASYRFQPGQRAGRLVEVWINWPLSFGR